MHICWLQGCINIKFKSIWFCSWETGKGLFGLFMSMIWVTRIKQYHLWLHWSNNSPTSKCLTLHAVVGRSFSRYIYTHYNYIIYKIYIYSLPLRFPLLVTSRILFPTMVKLGWTLHIKNRKIFQQPQKLEINKSHVFYVSKLFFPLQISSQTHVF